MKWWALIGMGLMAAVAFVDYVMVSTILTSIQSHLMATYTQLQWIINIYVLTLAVFMITMGRLGDLFGNRTLLMLGMIAFGISSFFCGLAPDPQWLIVTRGCQGLSAAIIFPCSISIINQLFASHHKGKAIGVWNAIATTGFAFGPGIAGLIVKYMGWRAIFFMNIPFTLIALIICVFTIEESCDQKQRVPMDWWGFFFMTTGTSCLITGIIQSVHWGWTAPGTLILFVVSLITLVLWILVEMTEKHPIINMAWFANSTFAACTISTATLACFALTFLFLTPLFLHNIQHYSFFMIGLILLPLTLPSIVFSPFVGQIVDKWGYKTPIKLGMLLLILSPFLQTFFSQTSPLWHILLSFFLFGIAWALVIGPVKIGVMDITPKNETGAAIGTLLTVEHLASATGLAILASIFRFKEHTSLMEGLKESGVQLSKGESLAIQSLLSHPLKIQEIFKEYGAWMDEKIIPIFQNAFLEGFHLMMWTAFFISLVTFLGTLFFLRTKKPSC